MAKQVEIRNSTAEFLIFQIEGKEDGVQVMYRNDTVWGTQKAMAQLFEVDRTVITKQLKNIFASAELQYKRVCANFAHTAADGKVYDTIYSTPSMLLSQWAIGSIPFVPPNSGNGAPTCSVNSPSVVM